MLILSFQVDGSQNSGSSEDQVYTHYGQVEGKKNGRSELIGTSLLLFDPVNLGFTYSDPNLFNHGFKKV